MQNTIKINSKIDNLIYVEKFVRSISNEIGFSKKLYIKVILSITEAFNNAIVHGNKYDVKKNVIIEFKRVKDKYKFTISDEGCGFDVFKIENPTIKENLCKESGRGIFIIKQYAEDVKFDKNGTKITMTFKK